MTHLGLVSATGTCSKGFDVVCFDRDQGLVPDLQAGRLPVLEPGLDDMLASNGGRQIFTSDPADLTTCDVVYIAPDVPTDDHGQSDLRDVSALIDLVVPQLSKAAVLVILCQVPPGFTRSLDFPTDRLFYQVETLIFGRAVERAVAPERFIVGCADPEAALPGRYRQLLEAFGCPILPMRYESAELAKISINCCLVASVTVANTLAELCENIGADWSEIAPALKLDRRIGPHAYLKPGLGIAGGNLERDLATVRQLAEEHGTDAGVVKAWIANSRHRKDWAFRLLAPEVFAHGGRTRIAILGLAYKEDTHSTKNSPAFALIRNLGGCELRVFDPAVPASAAPQPGPGASLQGAASALEACRDAHALAIMTPWPAFAELDPQVVAEAMRGDLLLDPYRVLDGKACAAAGLRYHTLGKARNQTC